jgi:hypothetical protein
MSRNKTRPIASNLPAEIEQPKFPNVISNGLAAAVGYGSTFPQNQGTGWSQQITQATTIFDNLRYYLVSNFRQMLSEAYIEIGLIQTICDVPVDDALRGGIEVKSKQLSEQEIAELLISVDRDDDLNIVGQAAKWNRLFGGAGVIILTDQDPAEPLDMEAIDTDTPLEFRACDMWELFWDSQNTDGYDPSIQVEDFTHYNYYGEQIHKSRVMRMKGLEAPSFVRPRLRGWGFSVVEALVRSLNQYLKATDLGFEVLDEFKLDIYKIKNLTATLMTPQGTEAVRQRLAIANYGKNYQNAVVMDAEDDFDHKQLSFSGLAEAMSGIRMQVASDMRMPMTKLFGISATGFNSGEDDIEVYNAMVESQVRNKIKYDILRILEIKCQKLFGYVPDDLSVAFKPLRVLSSDQEETVKTQKFTRLQQALQAGYISLKEYREAANKGNLFDVILDTSNDDLTGYDANVVEEGANNPDGEDDTDNPGTERTDTEKPKGLSTGGVPKGGGKPTPAKDAKDSKSIRDAKMVKPAKLSPDAPKQTVRNKFDVMPAPYSRTERIARVLTNSVEFDLASYESDGGDSWINPKRQLFFENPVGLSDTGLWQKAKSRSREVFGSEHWQFTVWWYRKQGGKFT